MKFGDDKAFETAWATLRAEDRKFVEEYIKDFDIKRASMASKTIGYYVFKRTYPFIEYIISRDKVMQQFFTPWVVMRHLKDLYDAGDEHFKLQVLDRVIKCLRMGQEAKEVSVSTNGGGTVNIVFSPSEENGDNVK